jgi:type IV pilus assembly protein PilY1
MYHCRYPKKPGYMVTFGTGRYLGDDDLDPLQFRTETIYGIWDFGDDADDSEYLGTFDRTTGRLSNFGIEDKVTLLRQVQVDWRTIPGHDLRTLSAHEPNWATTADDTQGQKPNPDGAGAGFGNDGLDNDDDGSVDEADEQVAHAGWYFDLPGFGPYTCPPDSSVIKGERVVKDYVIRDGVLIIMSIVPNTDRCSGGGDTMVHEINACTGGRMDEARFDIDDDGDIDSDDLIEITEDGETKEVAPTGITYPGILHPPVMVRLPDKPVEIKVFSTSAGETVTLKEVAERRGIYFWRDIR